MPTLPFEYHPDAVLEAHEAFHWYARRSEEVAERFWEELLRARRMVCERPHGWTPYFHGTRCFQFRRFPYALVYVENDEKVIGLAVCHRLRRPGYWKGRIED